MTPKAPKKKSPILDSAVIAAWLAVIAACSSTQMETTTLIPVAYSAE